MRCCYCSSYLPIVTTTVRAGRRYGFCAECAKQWRRDRRRWYREPYHRTSSLGHRTVWPATLTKGEVLDQGTQAKHRQYIRTRKGKDALA